MVNQLVAFLHVVFVVVWLCVLDFGPYLQVFCLDVFLLILFIYVIQCARALLIQERKWVEIVWLPWGYTLRCSFSIRCHYLAYTPIQLQILLHNRLLPIRTPYTKIKIKNGQIMTYYFFFYKIEFISCLIFLVRIICSFTGELSPVSVCACTSCIFFIWFLYNIYGKSEVRFPVGPLD